VATTRLLALLALLASVAAAVQRRRTHRRPPPRARIADLQDRTTFLADGAVRSVQTADLTMPIEALEALWSPLQLERLARTYWRYLSHVTLGLIQVDYGAEQRTVVLVRQPLRLLRFKAPEYEMEGSRGLVRWRIDDGLLVERRGHHGDGYLQIVVERRPGGRGQEGMAVAHVEVEVANFYPSIARRLSSPVYRGTQSRIHVLVTHGFLRSLARLDLAESRVGRYAAPPLPGEADQP
jgi:hypothetical protein